MYNDLMTKNHRQGKKITSKHTSTIESVAQLVDFLKINEHVSKIALGIITSPKSSRKSSDKTIKLLIEPACIFVRATQKNSIQEFRIYTNEIELVKTTLGHFIEGKGWGLRLG